MKTIISGSRTITDYNLIVSIIESAPFLSRITSTFCDMERGVSVAAYRWAYAKRLPIREFKPDWNGLGKAAGFVRGMEMAAFADAAIIIDDGMDAYITAMLKYMRGCQPKHELYLHTIHHPTIQESLLGGLPHSSVSHGSSPTGLSSQPVGMSQ